MSKSEKIFENLAFTTWETILNAFSNNISYGEDAITSVNLLSLRNASLNGLVLEDIRSQESTKGCDFEFWIGSEEKGWLRYAIQAKKISVSSNRYNSLAHKVNGVPQIDILERYSLENRAIPIYCLFNYSDDPNYIDARELGCSVTPLKTVRESLKTRGARTFNWFHRREETLPWSCLVRFSKIVKYWPQDKLGFNIKEMRHQQLPDVLSSLLLNGHSGQFPETDNSETFVNSSLFSQKVEHRPRWVGVVDLDSD